MRIVRRVLAVVATLFVLLIVTLWTASRFGVVQELVRTRLLDILRTSLDAQIDLGGVGGTLGRSLVLRDFRIAVAGHNVVRAPRVEVVYALLPLVRGRLVVRRFTLVAPRVRLVSEHGAWRLPRPAERHSGSSRTALDVRTFEIRDGRIAVMQLDASTPRRFAATAVALTAGAAIDARHSEVTIRDLRFTPRGIAVTPVRASGTVARESGGAVHVVDLRLATARTRLDARADVVPGRQVRGHVGLLLDAAELRAVVPASRLTTNVDVRAEASGPWHAADFGVRADGGAAGRVHARALVDLDHRAYAARAELAAVDPAAAVPGLVRGPINGRVHARGRGVGLGDPVSYRVGLARSEVAGHAVGRAILGGRGAHGVHRARGRVVAAAGETRLRGRLVTGATPAYRLAARLRLDRLDDLAPRLPGWIAAEARVAGRGFDTPRRHVDADVRLIGASLHGVEVHDGELRARLDGNNLRLETAELTGNGTTVRATGTADLERRAIDVTLDASANLRSVGERLGIPLGGAATFDATARGPLTAVAVEASTDVQAPAYGAVNAGHARARVEATGLGGTRPSGTVRIAVTEAQVRAYRRHTIDASLDWERADGADRARVDATATGDEGPPDRLAATLARSGETTTVALRELLATPPGGVPWHLLRPATVTVSPEAVTTDSVALAADAQRITLGGRIGFRGASDASLQIAGLDIAPLCAAASDHTCGGTVSVAARIAGKAEAPRLTADVRSDALRAADVDLGTLVVDARYEERQTTLHARLQHPDTGEVRADGTVPFDLAWAGPRRDTSEEPLALRARADRLDLRIAHALAPTQVRNAAGRLTLDAQVTGTRTAPRAEGRGTVADGRLELAATGAAYDDIRAELAAAGTVLEIRTLHARGGDGTLDASGHIDLTAARTVDVRAELADFFAVRRPELEAALGGTVRVGGTAGAPDVRADLEVDRAIVRPAALPTQDGAAKPDPSIVVISDGEPRAASAELPSVARAVKLGVTVRIERNAWVRRTDADIELGGDLKITKAPDEGVQIVGTIRLLRGWYVFQGRRFTLDEGTITFTGVTPANPSFDITAVFKNPNYRVTIHVGGTSQKPELTLSSDPPLEQADILSVIIFGKPARDLGKGESIALQQQALQLASGYVMPELRASVMDALGLDTLDVEMPQGTDRRGRVSVGRYVAGDVFVSLAQEFGARAGEAVGVEYGLTPEISIKGSTSTRGDSAIDVFWHRRY